MFSLLSLTLPYTFGQLRPPPKEQTQPLVASPIEVLSPVNVFERMREIQDNPGLLPQEKTERMDDLLITIPSEIVDGIPPRPDFFQLSKETHEAINRVASDNINRWNHSPPEKEKTSTVRPWFEPIPDEQLAQIQTIENDKGVSYRDRYYKIKGILQSLPREISAQLVPPPPPYDFLQI